MVLALYGDLLLLLASPQCVQGFFNEEAVKIAADVYATRDTYNVRRHLIQQRIIPGINFTCTGALTKWIIGAQQTPTQATNHLQLQIWRRRQGSSSTYDRTTFSDITAVNATDDLNVYEYIPNPPLQFQTNDILGLYQPWISNTQVLLYYQSGGGPKNFAVFSWNPLTSRSTTGGVDNDLPLVTVEVNGKLNIHHLKDISDVNCFLQEEMLETALKDLSLENSWLMKHS